MKIRDWIKDRKKYLAAACGGAIGKNLTPLELPPLPDGWKDVKNLQGAPAPPEKK
jgi:hypothetical protein